MPPYIQELERLGHLIAAHRCERCLRPIEALLDAPPSVRCAGTPGEPKANRKALLDELLAAQSSFMTACSDAWDLRKELERQVEEAEALKERQRARFEKAKAEMEAAL